jgi:hypothetical protein
MKLTRFPFRCVLALLTFLLNVSLSGPTQAAQPVTSDDLKRAAQQAELQRLQQQQEQATRQQERRALLARALQIEINSQDLLQMAQDFDVGLNALLDSDQGRAIAQDEKLFETFYRLFRWPLVAVPEAQAKAATATALVQQLRIADTPPEVGYAPGPQLRQDIESLDRWVTTRKDLLQTQLSTVKVLSNPKPTGQDLSQAPSLRDAVTERESDWEFFFTDAWVQGRQLAETEGIDALKKAVFQAYLKRIELEKELIVNRMEALMEQLRNENQVAMLTLQHESATRLAEAEEKHKNAMAQIETLRNQGVTDRTVAAINARIGDQAKLDQAHQEQLKALARSPEVQSLLAPFLAQGYHQPGHNAPYPEKGPVKLSCLADMGALRPGTAGLRALLTAGTAVRDMERPRWPFPKRLQQCSPQELDQLSQAQQYLIDLGSIMVELGMLAP